MTEQEAAYKYNFDTPKYLVMYNEQETNRYGDHKGYRILPEQMSKMLLPEDYRGAKARSWTNYQVEYSVCFFFMIINCRVCNMEGLNYVCTTNSSRLNRK